MKKILVAIAVVFVVSSKAWAVTDVNETAGNAMVTTFSVGNSSAVDMSSSTVITSPFAYNITNNDASIVLYCGYSNKVTASGNYQGFKVLPGATAYRAVTYGTIIYCIAASGTISVTRELFGRPF